MSEKNKTILSDNNDIINLLSRDLHYDKFVRKMGKKLKDLDKNILLYCLVNNLIDENGLWMVFGSSKYNNINHIAHYSKKKVFSFIEQINSTSTSENVEIIEGNFSESIISFKKTNLKTNNSYISFICINLKSVNLVFQLLLNLYIKINNNCVIIFNSLVNFYNYEKSALKAVYNFFNSYKINFEWIGMDGKILKSNYDSNDGFMNTNNQAVGIRILDNPFFKKIIKVEKTPQSDFEIFDWEKYVEYYSDLEFKTKESAWNHWINNGCNEKRIFFTITNEENFDWETYKSNYADLSDLSSKEEAWRHWITHGKLEGRSYLNLNENELKRVTSLKKIHSDFDWEFYVNYHKDLTSITNEVDAWDHWINYGNNENRLCKFDWCAYIGNLKIHSINTKEEALQHWMNNGKTNFIIPNNFNWLAYLVKNADLLSLINTESEAKYHWINFGQFENRCYE